jgi:hypothetical protein
MTAVLTWIFSLSLGLGLLEMTRANNLFALNGLIALAISVNLALLARRDIQINAPSTRMVTQGAITTMWILTLVWAWLAMSSLLLHSSAMTFEQTTARIGSFVGASLLSACFAVLLDRTTAYRVASERLHRLLRLARLMAAMQGVAALIIVLMIVNAGGVYNIRADWAGNNVLLFGALALIAVAGQAVISLGHAIDHVRQRLIQLA